MNHINVTRIAINALNRNKLRAFLTMLGIIIGVASVIAMIAIGQGSKKSIQDEMAQMGTNLIFIKPGNEMFGGLRMSQSETQSMTLNDVDQIRESCPDISAVTPVVNTNIQAVKGNSNWPTSVYGVNSEYLTIKKYSVKAGRNFSEREIKSLAKVCMIGQTVAENLFSDGTDAVGQNIRLGSYPFKVIGLLNEKGENGMGHDQDDIILAPYTAVQKRMLAITHIHSISASAVSEEANNEAINEVTESLRRSHKLKPGEENDFAVRSQSEMVETFSSISDIMTTLLGAIASISLLVGGIGIMNIMYVSVTERTREIGLRLSVGGKERDILTQFLVESIMLSVAGGIIGIFLGILISQAISFFMSWPAVISPSAIAVSFIVSTMIGVFFGWYPARKAARLNPIEALRYE